MLRKEMYRTVNDLGFSFLSAQVCHAQKVIKNCYRYCDKISAVCVFGVTLITICFSKSNLIT
jgi:hypothetical protein